LSEIWSDLVCFHLVTLEKLGYYGILDSLGGSHHLDSLNLWWIIIEHNMVIVLGLQLIDYERVDAHLCGDCKSNH
jgi:hypothetical protein